MAAKRKRPTATVDGYDIPPELFDADAAVWHDQAAHLAYMAARDWVLDVRDRMGPGAPAQARRQAAARGWAIDRGITVAEGGHADYHRLRAMGMYP